LITLQKWNDFKKLSGTSREPKSVLDVGCGPGVFLYLLEREREIKGVGIEITDSKVKYANEHLHVLAQKGDAGNLPFEDRSFDVVVALEVLEHLPYGTYECALREMARVASKTILITVPYNEDRFFMRCPYCQTRFNPSYHLRTFREDSLVNLFQGFTIKKIDKIGIIYAYPKILKRLYDVLYEKRSSSEFVCPACGYGNPPHKINYRQYENETLPVSKPLINVFKNIAPKKKTPRWALALYHRRF